MKVWIVNVWGREGNECLGTFSTKEAAQAKFEEFMNDHKPDSADESDETMEYLLGLQNGHYIKVQNEELLLKAEILETDMDAKIWVVKLWEHDDGPEILGVCDNKEKAQAKFEEYMNSHKPDDEDQWSKGTVCDVIYSPDTSIPCKGEFIAEMCTHIGDMTVGVEHLTPCEPPKIPEERIWDSL